METVREAKLKVCPGVLEMPPGVTVVCHADAFLALLAECQLMGEVAAGVDPSQQKHARAISNAHQESLEVNLGGDPAVPGWPSVGQAEVWNTRATSLARRLESQSISADQLFVLLNAMLPTGWDSKAGITLSNEESGRHLRNLGFIGSATTAILRMRKVAHADASLAGELRAAAMSSGRQHGCRRLANFPYGTCCQACPQRHTGQCFERQRRSGAAQGTTGVEGTNHAPIHLRGGRQPPRASRNSMSRERADVGPYSNGRTRTASRASGRRQAL